MLVNAATAPGPALWQGLMLCLLPLVVIGMYHKDGKYFGTACAIYAVVGVVLLVVIVTLGGAR